MKNVIKAMVFLNLAFSVQAQARTVSLMTYNVENLFDSLHDEGKEDWTYLPAEVKKKSAEVQAYCKKVRNPHYKDECFKLDWSEAIINKKIQQISKVIRAYDGGKGPDILVVQEVENLNVLTMLRDRGLKGMGYKEVVLLEGPDERGIDVGMISRFPLAAPAILHKVDFSEISGSGGFSPNTRGILEATFDIEGQSVTVFGNHWSSQQNIDKTRWIAARTLFNAAKDIKDSAVIATGDFNTIETDNPHGLNDFILSENREISFYDAVSPFGLDKNLESMIAPPDQGSHWYQGKWQFLDHIFLMKSSTAESEGSCTVRSCISPLWGSFGVHKPDFMLREISYVDRRTGTVTKFKVPWRFDATKGEGFSDHCPIALKFVVNE